ncbi:hypothetical protein Desor_3489 [Desulfosporosinus orientis DSM 765]|uniref:Uncharacterized protein n=1 Tax=Desulfosporosinus orientis (strain ATCC 19365 / DSM 765 / NCIMB 8382 / VKM B-1628 / Singapore I) TaxID=768706 RepID=G7WGW4_DESOD|nr:hypothetical protein [Desulfosporosinus orientis]AET68978.1 hypothetical protein Desor_3489 [Desulfosporosinus orientis DSM 765]
MFDEDNTIKPIDSCGCGDTGYLTLRTIPIDLAHGVGYIENVPVYHCRSASCQEFSFPSVVSRRLDTIAEEMEETQNTHASYSWEDNGALNHGTQPEVPSSLSQSNTSIPLQAFTLQFVNREYEDAKVVQIVPGEAVFLQSKLEETEYYQLRYEEDPHGEGTWFSLQKFYYDKAYFSYEDFLTWSEDGHLKELGRIPLNEVEDTLLDEFGEEVS